MKKVKIRQGINNSKGCAVGSSGFIRLIIIIIVILVIAAFYGYSPEVLWSKYIAPVILFVWAILVWVAEFLVELVRAAVSSVKFFADFLPGVGE